MTDLYASVIDSRDIIDLIEEFEDDHPGLAEIVAGDDEAFKQAVFAMIGDEAANYIRAKKFKEEAGYVADWVHGVSLIADAYFTQYAEEMAYDTGAVDKDAGWPNNHIDWDAAADALQQDYEQVTVDGDVYWVR